MLFILGFYGYSYLFVDFYGYDYGLFDFYGYSYDLFDFYGYGLVDMYDYGYYYLYLFLENILDFFNVEVILLSMDIGFGKELVLVLEDEFYCILCKWIYFVDEVIKLEFFLLINLIEMVKVWDVLYWVGIIIVKFG